MNIFDLFTSLSTSDKIATIGTGSGVLIYVADKIYSTVKENLSRKNTKPELTVELKSTGERHSRQMGVSSNPANVPMVPMEDGSGRMAIDGNNAWRVFEMTINMQLIIRNNSDNTAYYPKVHYLTNERFTSIDDLDITKSIPSGAEVILDCKYIFYEDCHPTKRTDITKLIFPPEINLMRILVEYQNAAKYIFYTEYKQVDKSYRFLNAIP